MTDEQLASYPAALRTIIENRIRELENSGWNTPDQEEINIRELEEEIVRRRERVHARREERIELREFLRRMT